MGGGLVACAVPLPVARSSRAMTRRMGAGTGGSGPGGWFERAFRRLGTACQADGDRRARRWVM